MMKLEEFIIIIEDIICKEILFVKFTLWYINGKLLKYFGDREKYNYIKKFMVENYL